MASDDDAKNMAIFCDFENVALGVKDTGKKKFNIGIILERLLLKGKIVVKKAYCDWKRYEEFKTDMHEASFELIEIPHVRQSGKNSADIRMVVDALDLCYTKEHADTFVIISGDSDFSPLVSKLRENNKTVIGVGVKNSTSDLLIANCDEFIFYDDLDVPKRKKKAATKKSATSSRSSRARKTTSTSKSESSNQEIFELLVETYNAILQERDNDDVIWGSMLKQTLKRRNPSFSESSYGFSSFGKLLEQAEAEGYFMLERDARSGGFIITPGENG